MALTYVRYPAEPGDTEFDITFPYVDVSDLSVRLDDDEVPFTLISPTRIALATPVATEAELLIRRVTDTSTPAVTFTNNSILTDDDLNRATRQVLYRTQEVSELVDEAITFDPNQVSIIRDDLDTAVDAITAVGSGLATANALRSATYVHLLDVVPQTLWGALQSSGSTPVDMTPYILEAAGRLPRGGTIRCDGLWVYIGTQLVLPENIVLWAGDRVPDEPNTSTLNYRLSAGQLLTNPALTTAIVCNKSGSGVLGFTIQKSNLVTPPPNAAAAEAFPGSLTGTAIRVDGQTGMDGYGVTIRHNLFLGYATAVATRDASRADISYNNGHCGTMISSEAAFDLPKHELNHNWPFVTAHINYGNFAPRLRTGLTNTAYRLGNIDYDGVLPNGGVDWGQAFRLFSYGANKGIVVADSDNTSIVQSGVDGYYGSHALEAGYNDIGFSYQGRIRRASIMDAMVSSQTYGIYVNMLPDEYLGGSPPVNGFTGGEVIQAVNLKIGASRLRSYHFETGNFTGIGGVSTIFTDPANPTGRTHMTVRATFGRLDFIGTTFYNLVDVDAETLSDARDVGLMGCRFVNMTVRYFYNNQLQGATYIRGNGTAFHDEAALVIENRAAFTGTATGQAWKVYVPDSGNFLIRDESDGVDVFNITPQPGTERTAVLAAKLRVNADLGATSRFYMTPVSGSFGFALNNAAEPAGVAMIVESADGLTVDGINFFSGGQARIRVDQFGLRRWTAYGTIIPIEDDAQGPDVTSNTYTTTVADAGGRRRFTAAGATTVTLRADARVGERFVAYQLGGQLTFAAASGAFVISLRGLKSAGVGSRVLCECVNNAGGAAAEWVLSGDTTT